jgi:hypothetical protein
MVAVPFCTTLFNLKHKAGGSQNRNTNTNTTSTGWNKPPIDVACYKAFTTENDMFGRKDMAIVCRWEVVHPPGHQSEGANTQTRAALPSLHHWP